MLGFSNPCLSRSVCREPDQNGAAGTQVSRWDSDLTGWATMQACFKLSQTKCAFRKKMLVIHIICEISRFKYLLSDSNYLRIVEPPSPSFICTVNLQTEIARPPSLVPEPVVLVAMFRDLTTLGAL